jgi:pimeloyl-ACP methyl ester carboxylesterase
MARGRARGGSRGEERPPAAPPRSLEGLGRIRAGGVELALDRLGAAHRGAAEARAGGCRLILLHGGPGLDHHLLLPLGRLLAERTSDRAGGWEVLLPDLPGHGGSIPPSGRLPGLAALEDRLASWLAGLPGGYDALIGHSMGAWLVTRLLRQGRVAPRAVVLLSPPAAGQARGATALRRAVAAMATGGRSGRTGRSTRSGKGRARELERARRELRAHVAAETGGAARADFLAAVERVAVRDPRGYGALLRDFHRALTGPVRPFDPGCPVLVLCGERDLTTPPDQARRVADSLAGARLELIEDAGHYPFAERPEAVTERLRAFLEQHLKSSVRND